MIPTRRFATIRLATAVALSLALCVAAAAPVSAQAPHRAILKEKLLRDLTRISNDFDGVMGVEIVDLTDSSRIGVNQDLVFPQGSAIKIPILLELFRRADRDPALLGKRHSISSATRTGGSGVLQFFTDGGSELSNEDLAVLMITLSDNGATNMLIDALGMDSVNRTMASLGLKQTKLQRRMITPASSARGEENISTPAEAAAVMARLSRCELPLSKSACERVREILELPKNEAVRSVIPDGVPVASKPGGIVGVATSWALVELPDRPFVITVMTNYGGGDGDAAIREAAKAALAYFTRLQRSTPYGTRVPRSVFEATRVPQR
ncbi:MAG TPA: serine hydrolase [Gemmatimonadaceae bacterium]|nr:serine hydrolase [Gemmatimonadaceae bacterium]